MFSTQIFIAKFKKKIIIKNSSSIKKLPTAQQISTNRDNEYCCFCNFVYFFLSFFKFVIQETNNAMFFTFHWIKKNSHCLDTNHWLKGYLSTEEVEHTDSKIKNKRTRTRDAEMDYRVRVLPLVMTSPNASAFASH